MTFSSILFERLDDDRNGETLESPAFLGDLNLDQLIGAITADWKDYELLPFYHMPLNDLDAIAYRQQVMSDLEDEGLMQVVRAFSEQMRAMRDRLDHAKKRDCKHAMERWFLDAVEVYCEAVGRLSRDVCLLNAKSRGLTAFREYLMEYVASVSFRNLLKEAAKLKSDLSAIRYCLRIKDGGVTVRHYGGASDYSVDVEKTFEKFRGRTVGNYSVKTRNRTGMNHIQAQVLDRVALLFPRRFSLSKPFARRTLSVSTKVSCDSIVRSSFIFPISHTYKSSGALA